MASEAEVKPPPMLYLLIDGDGHHEMLEPIIIAKCWDLITSNQEVTFKHTIHTMAGRPLTVIEVL